MENNQNDISNVENEEVFTRKVNRSKKNQSPFKKVSLYVIAIIIAGLIIILFAFYNEARMNKETEIQKELDALGWVEQMLLPENEFSRPATLLEKVNGIVIHNIGNPNTTALQNRNYFANVVPVERIFASSHFIVCLDGSIIQCVPINEIAYASNARNVDTISIEVCHPDATGKFNDASYDAAVRLTAWLSVRFNLTSNDIIRHFDVEREIGPKECPRYFVDNEDAWVLFKADVQRAITAGRN